MQQALLRYYGNAIKDLTCHNTIILCGYQCYSPRGCKDSGPLNVLKKPQVNKGNFPFFLRRSIKGFTESLTQWAQK
jgi:hypothetical protein